MQILVNWKRLKDKALIKNLERQEAALRKGGPVIRLPGYSREGPCAVCAQWFGVVHDESGRIVPKKKLCRLCVCRDMNVNVMQVAGKSVTPLKRYEWLAKTPSERYEWQKTLDFPDFKADGQSEPQMTIVRKTRSRAAKEIQDCVALLLEQRKKKQPENNVSPEVDLSYLGLPEIEQTKDRVGTPQKMVSRDVIVAVIKKLWCWI